VAGFEDWSRGAYALIHGGAGLPQSWPEAAAQKGVAWACRWPWLANLRLNKNAGTWKAALKAR